MTIGTTRSPGIVCQEKEQYDCYRFPSLCVCVCTRRCVRCLLSSCCRLVAVLVAVVLVVASSWLLKRSSRHGESRKKKGDDLGGRSVLFSVLVATQARACHIGQQHQLATLKYTFFFNIDD